MIKSIRSLLYFFVVLLALGAYLVHYQAPKFILQPPRVQRMQLGEQPGFNSLEVSTKEGFTLVGAHRSTAQPRAALVLLHGVGSSKEIWQEEMNWLAEQGIASFAFDNRGQGRSGGEYVTFGYHEADDLRRIADLMEQTYPGIPLGIWGYSLGGAVALQSLAKEKRWTFGIVESTFARLDHTVRAYQVRHARGVRLHWLTDYALARAGKLADFDPLSILPAEAAKRISVPVFHAHGDADVNIVPENARLIHANLSYPDSELVMVAGADHSGLYTAGGTAYLQRIAAFLDRVLAE